MIEAVRGRVLEGDEAEEAQQRWAAWEASVAEHYAGLPLPRRTLSLLVVLAPGSLRRHLLEQGGEVVGMLSPIWPITEARWSAVRTLCGRSGPFRPTDLRLWRQDCGRCWKARPDG